MDEDEEHKLFKIIAEHTNRDISEIMTALTQTMGLIQLMLLGYYTL